MKAAGRFEVLAHAAGISPTMGDWRDVLRVNLVGSALLLEAFRPLAGPGAVGVCWSSSAAYMAGPGRGDAAIEAVIDDPLHSDLLSRLESLPGSPFIEADGAAAAYGWSKRGVIRLVQREALTWGKSGARLLAVSPGIVDTAMARYESTLRPAMMDMVAACPVPRMGTAAEVADLVAFLVSMEASFITGTDILIDGGFAAALAGMELR